jgi:hypothetical protein
LRRAGLLQSAAVLCGVKQGPDYVLRLIDSAQGRERMVNAPELGLLNRAGEGNRTLMTSLEGCDYASCDLH